MKKWFENGVFYQIYPLSFKDSNNDGYGDLPGIIQKIDYVKNLGANAIWLSPFFKSPMKDFGYDVSAYKKVDRLFGTFRDIEKLISEIHKREMKIIIDLVLNHTSDEHHWFKESRSSKDNPRRNFYVWQPGHEENGKKKPPNNWLSIFGGSAWTYDETTDEWYFHSFLPEQPDLNWKNSQVKEEMFKIIDFWLTAGVDGFRGDAIDNLYEDPEFIDEDSNPYYRAGIDNPYNTLVHSKTTSLPETIKLINEIAEHTRKFGEIFFITEAYLDINGLANVYQNCPAKNHSPFNFNLMSLPWGASAYKKFIDRYIEISKDLPKNYVLGNHDRSRTMTRLGKEKSMALALLSMTLPGSTFVYYGDEIGMLDIDIEKDKILDPFGKRISGIDLGRDAERGVMQWDDSEFAGFSNVSPWVGIPREKEKVNVAMEGNDSQSILNFYKKIISFKKDPVFLEGDYRSMSIWKDAALLFKRAFNGKEALVIVNMSDKEVAMPEEQGGTLVVSSYDDIPDLKSPLRSNEGRVIFLN